jgi:hypothetical protein
MAIISGYKNHFHLQHDAHQLVEVGRLALPAESYSIWAKAYLGIPRPEGLASTLRFRLQAGNDFDAAIVSHDGTLPFASVALNVVHRYVTAGSATLTCEFLWTAGDTDIEFIKITAVSSGSLMNAPLPA